MYVSKNPNTISFKPHSRVGFGEENLRVCCCAIGRALFAQYKTRNRRSDQIVYRSRQQSWTGIPRQKNTYLILFTENLHGLTTKQGPICKKYFILSQNNTMCVSLINFRSGYGFSTTNVKCFVLRRKEATQGLTKKLSKFE